MNRRRIFAVAAISMGIVLLTTTPSAAKPRSLRNLRCPKSAGIVELIPRPVSDITLQSGQQIDLAVAVRGLCEHTSHFQS